MRTRGRIFSQGIVLALALGGASWLSAANRAAQEQAAARLFSNIDPVPQLRIEISEDDLDTLRGSRKGKGSEGRERPEVAVTVREGTNVFRRVALHLKGSAGSFQSVDQKPALTLHFDENVPGQRFHGLEKISLNNSAQDPTYLCEHLGRMAFTQAGLPTPRVTHARVSLNGRLLGLYVLVEGWNKQFLRRHFPDPEGAFFEPPFRVDLPGRMELKSGHTADGARALAALESALDENTPSARWAALGRTMDRDRFMTGLALEVLLNHWDGYARNQNNFRLFHDRPADRILFLPHGMDQLFGLRRPETEMPLLPEFRGRIAQIVMETRAGQRRFFERAGWLLTNVFRVEPMTDEVRRLEGRIRLALADTPSARAQFDAQVPLLLQRIEDRHARLLDELPTADGAQLFLRTNTARLGGWNFRRSNRNYEIPAATPRVLPIRGISSRSGQWETTLLLEPGQYRFAARAEITGLPPNMAGYNAVLMVRGTAGRDARQLFAANGRANLTHSFTLDAARVVTLSCEFQSPAGLASFDRSSLQLSRVGD